MRKARFIILLVLLAGCSQRQEYIHERGSMVMPFSMSDTTHVFHKTEDGGLQQVLVKNGSDESDIIMIRQHLQEIAQEFSDGNFSDPKTLHGEDMPGVATLEDMHESLDVNYTKLSNGAQIMYQSADPEVVEAIHEWFDAQLMDHGQDAMADPYGTDCDEVPEGHDPEMWRLHHGC